MYSALLLKNRGVKRSLFTKECRKIEVRKTKPYSTSGDSTSGVRSWDFVLGEQHKGWKAVHVVEEKPIRLSRLIYVLIERFWLNDGPVRGIDCAVCCAMYCAADDARFCV